MLLCVPDAEPKCSSSVGEEGAVGPNSCDIEPEMIDIVCQINYTGNYAPVMKFSSQGSQAVPAFTVKDTNIHGVVTYTLTTAAHPDINGVQFVCTITLPKTECSSANSTILYSWTSDVIKILCKYLNRSVC